MIQEESHGLYLKLWNSMDFQTRNIYDCITNYEGS